jgi:N-methylhydantoinase B
MTAPSSIDQVSLGIMWERLISITDEIVTTLVRTSFSTIVREAYDLTAVLLDAEGRLLAQGRWSAPPFIGTAPLTMRHILDRFPAETLRPGDVIVTNDPWIGTGHLFDICVMRPVFRQDKLAGFSMSITHLPDIGGAGFGTTATEIYQEGLRLPPCKLVDAGVLDERLIEIIRANVRVPDHVVGDIMANVSCNEVGARQLVAFMDEYDLDDLSVLSRAICARSEALTREKIRAMRPGVYRNSLQLEGIDAPITLACAVTVEGDEITIDLAGTDPCVERGINVPYCYTNAMALYAMKCMTTPDLPNNDGSTKPMKVVAPPGCILNAQPPSPTGGRHVIGHFVSPLIFGALADAAPDLVQADCGMIDLVNFVGTKRNGRRFSEIYFAAGGFGAVSDKDGPETTPGPSNMATVATEMWERTTGTLVERKAFLPDTGGRGAQRGGVGQEIVIGNDTGHPLTVFCMANRTEFPAEGLRGGEPGSKRLHRINADIVHPKGRYVLQPDDKITLIQAGGGGFGEPAERDLERVDADILEGFTAVRNETR